MKDPRVCQRRSLGLARFSMSSDGARTSFGSLRALNTPRSLGKSWNILGWRNISKYHLLNHCIRFHTLNWIPRKQLQKGHRLSGCWPVTVTSEHFRANKIKHVVRQPPKSAQKQQCKSIEPCQLKRCAHQFWRILCGFPVQSTVFSSQSFVRGSNFSFLRGTLGESFEQIHCGPVVAQWFWYVLISASSTFVFIGYHWIT